MLLSSEAGSAPVDFVLITLPTSLLLLPLFGLFSLAQEQIVIGQVAYDLARFAALADVSQNEIDSYRENKDEGATITRVGNGSSCFVQASITKSARLSFWPEQVSIIGTSRARCEVD